VTHLFVICACWRSMAAIITLGALKLHQWQAALLLHSNAHCGLIIFRSQFINCGPAIRISYSIKVICARSR
jgi:hypothetical protein